MNNNRHIKDLMFTQNISLFYNLEKKIFKLPILDFSEQFIDFF